jgi:DegV family protein with EDD domain
MMQNIRIVSDSFAHFVQSGSQASGNAVIVHNRITINGRTYREGLDLSAEDALRLLAHQHTPPALTPPSVAEYIEALRPLRNEVDAIIVLTASRAMFSSWANARAAAQSLTGACRIEILDTGTLASAQGMLVKLALRSAPTAESVDDLIRLLRGACERVYAIYCTDTTDFVMQTGVMPRSHGILGAMLSIKPVLTVEAGRLMAIEKVKTRVQAVEKMAEFASEFEEIEEAVIVQPKAYISDTTRMLQDRLNLQFPTLNFPHTIYGPSLTALIGTDATGLIILETEQEDFADEF